MKFIKADLSLSLVDPYCRLMFIDQETGDCPCIDFLVEQSREEIAATLRKFADRIEKGK